MCPLPLPRLDPFCWRLNDSPFVYHSRSESLLPLDAPSAVPPPTPDFLTSDNQVAEDNEFGHVLGRIACFAKGYGQRVHGQ